MEEIELRYQKELISREELSINQIPREIAVKLHGHFSDAGIVVAIIGTRRESVQLDLHLNYQYLMQTGGIATMKMLVYLLANVHIFTTMKVETYTKLYFTSLMWKMKSKEQQDIFRPPLGMSEIGSNGFLTGQ